MQPALHMKQIKFYVYVTANIFSSILRVWDLFFLGSFNLCLGKETF
jgi:hypothetical protein